MVIRQPSQPLPWSVEDQEGDCVVLDAHGMWVCNCGVARAEADFIVAVANQWHRQQRKAKR